MSDAESHAIATATAHATATLVALETAALEGRGKRVAADVRGWVDAVSRAVDRPDIRARIKAGPCPEVGEDREPCPGDCPGQRKAAK